MVFHDVLPLQLISFLSSYIITNKYVPFHNFPLSSFLDLIFIHEPWGDFVSWGIFCHVSIFGLICHVLEMLIANLFKIEKQDMIKICHVGLVHK